MSENVPIGYTVLKITSTDADIGENAVATYTLTSDPVDVFALDSKSGAVTVIGVLDYETKREYILRVQADDGAYRAETSITIDILDTNDNAPIFGQPSYEFDLVEAIEVGAVVGQVSASDIDADGANSELFYTWRVPSGLLMVNTDTGLVTTLQEVTYQESENVFLIQAVATDRGNPPLSSEVMVRIHMRHSNTYNPVFDQERYDAYIADNSPSGTHIITLNAT